MIVEMLTVRNWFRYRGEHQLTLGPETHAVVARLEGAEGRSNWLGKSTLLAAIPFALFGVHPAPTEDEWITHGEKDGEVRIFTSGFEVVRLRKRGVRTELSVIEDGKLSTGGEAQTLIERRLGLTKDDFFNSCFFRQKELARFITSGPAERQKILSEWLGLERVQQAESIARGDLKRILKDLRTVSQTIEFVSGELDGQPKPSEIDAEAKEAEERADRFEKSAGDLRSKMDEEVEALAKWEADNRAAEELARVVQRGKALRKVVDGFSSSKGIDEFETELEKARVEERIVEADVRRLRTLSRGAFDGTCPVARCPCPITDRINAEGAKHREAAEQASKALEMVERTAEDAARRLRAAREAQSSHEAAERSLEALRERADELRPAAKRAKGNPPKQEAADLYRSALSSAVRCRSDATRLREKAESLRAQDAKRGEAQAREGALRAELATVSEAIQIFGRNGAQRRIAEDAVSQIEGLANGLLSGSGIDLSLRVSWAREASSGLATACETCGAAFPKSQRVKECSECGAERGPKTIDRLDVIPSNRSGGADDLAGIAFQLAAAAWLRKSRSSAWSVAVLDEPFGSLDPANRRALSAFVATALKRLGFEQSFVIAHSESEQEALSRRIEITASGADSSVRVI